MQGAQLAIGVLAGILVLQLQHTDLTVRSGSTSSQPRISSQTDSNGSMRVRYVRSPSEFFVRRYLRCGVGGAARWTNQLTLDTRDGLLPRMIAASRARYLITSDSVSTATQPTCRKCGRAPARLLRCLPFAAEMPWLVIDSTSGAQGQLAGHSVLIRSSTRAGRSRPSVCCLPDRESGLHRELRRPGHRGPSGRCRDTDGRHPCQTRRGRPADPAGRPDCPGGARPTDPPASAAVGVRHASSLHTEIG